MLVIARTDRDRPVCLQETARKRKGWSLDSVCLGSDVMRCYKDDVKTAPLEGVYVHGLVLDNAAWDARTSRIVGAKQQVCNYSYSTVGYILLGERESYNSVLDREIISLCGRPSRRPHYGLHCICLTVPRLQLKKNV